MNNNETMKKSELQDIIREALLEVIKEDAAADEKAQKMALAGAKEQINALIKKKSELSSRQIDPTEKNAERNAIDQNIKTTQAKINRLSKPGLSSIELEEMANVGIRYQLADDVTPEQIAAFTGKKARIVQAIQAAGSAVSKMNVAGDMGYDKQNPINKDFMELVDSGVIVPSGEQVAKRPTTKAATPEPEATPAGEEEFYNPRGRKGRTGSGGMFTSDELSALGLSGKEEMSDDEVDAAFAAAMASGEEPEPEFAAKGEKPKSNVTISDEDFQDWMEYKKLSDRLTSVKSNLLKAKRYRGTPGDINDAGSTAREIKGLTDLKASLEQRIDALVKKSEYLQKDIAKKAGKELPPPIENPLEDEDEVDGLDENVISKLQYYAGIKK